MKFSVLQDGFKKGLGIVNRAIGGRTTLPIINNVYIEAAEGKLKLVATNLEMTITAWIGAKVDEVGKITVPAKTLTEFVNSLPNDRIDVFGDTRIRLTCARIDARMNGMSADEFPTIPMIDGTETVVLIDPQVLRTMIQRTQFSTASEATRPVLAGVYVALKDKDVTFAAADGFRLSVQKAKVIDCTGDRSVIIPSQTLTEVARLAQNQEDPIEVLVGEGKIRFRFTNTELVSQLISGTFPNYQQLIPKSSESKAVVNVAEFLRAVRSVLVFAKNDASIIKVVSNGNQLEVFSTSEDHGDNKGSLDVNIEGTPVKIAFNGTYLQEVLSVIGTGQITLETTSPSVPGVIKVVDDDNFSHVLMPMMVGQWS